MTYTQCKWAGCRKHKPHYHKGCNEVGELRVLITPVKIKKRAGKGLIK